ncbi:cation diffusion facilitator family transporter [[Eubacterium] cellulosolvens]
MNLDLHKKALNLSYFTVGYNIIEGIVSILVALLSGSVALLGFGLDSFVESFSGFIMIWRFKKKRRPQEEEKIENRAVRLVGYTFFILAFYVAFESIKKLYQFEAPNPSILGIIIAILSIIIMPILSHMKYQTGKLLKSRSLIADSKETLACAALSIALLIGLGLNYFFGLWQADPVIGLVIAAFLIREGYESFIGEE